MATQGICTFTGVVATKGWDFTFGPGITPSVCVITTLENRSLGVGLTGTLVLEQDGLTITFPNCRIASRTITSGRGGTYVKLAIQDRRWRWQFTQIDGSYNVRKSASNIIREKTPQELATLLFTAMGETGFTVSDLPNGPDVFPEADWQGVPAAPLLSELCNSLGCMVVLDAATNLAKIVKIGEGTSLPPGGRIIRQSSPTVLNAVPDEVRFMTGPTLFHETFDLEPVGVDIDGTIKHINELSYAPPMDNWARTDPYGFYDIKGTYTEEGEIREIRDLAKATVWKMYRVSGIDDEPNGRWGLAALSETPYQTDKLLDFLPFRQTSLWTDIDDDGEEQDRPYTIFGSFAWPEEQAVFTGEDNATPRHVIKAWHRLDGEKGIVYFNLPMFKWGAGNKVNFALLDITTSFVVNKDGILIRHEEYRPMVQPGEELGTGPFLIRRNDLRRKVIDSEFFPSDNVADIKKEADYYIAQWKRTLESNTALSRIYSRMLQWSVDGLTMQITWSGGAGRPATTQISQGSEHNPYVPSYRKKVAEIENQRITAEAKFTANFDREVFK